MNKSLDSWKEVAAEYDLKEILKPIRKKISEFSSRKKKIHPCNKDIFRAFKLTPFKDVKIIILGQDPYHGPNQAHGLCFSVPNSVKPPPSLVNIFKELQSDIGKIINPGNGNLEHWAEQGVFLLNTTLTVEQSKPLSHQNYGWGEFTDKVISVIDNRLENIVFILWGAFAQSKKNLIDSKKHLILTAPHPSPLSAHRGFFGSKPFSQTNTFLQSKQIDKIIW